MNMVSESNQTSLPKSPPGSKVAPLLATKATAMPSATGTSMAMRRRRHEAHAPAKNGAAQKAITGSVNSQLVTSSSCLCCGARSPGALK